MTVFKSDEPKAVEVLPNQIPLIAGNTLKKTNELASEAIKTKAATDFTYTAEELAAKLKVSTARLSQLKKQFELEQGKHYYFTDDREIRYYQNAYNKLQKRPIKRLSKKFSAAESSDLKTVKKIYRKEETK